MILIVTGIVTDGALDELLPDPEAVPLLLELLELCAMALTCVIRPPTVPPLGSWTLTGSPTTASLCLVASSWTVTTSWLDVVCRIAWADEPADAVPEVPEVAEPPLEDAPALTAAVLAPVLRLPLEPVPVVALRDPLLPVPLLPVLLVEERDDDSVFFSSSVSAFSSASSTASWEGLRL